MTHQKVQSGENQASKQSNSSKQSASVQKTHQSIIQDIMNLYISRD